MHPKVVGSISGTSLGGALSIIVIWGLSLAHVDVPSEVGAAFTTVICSLLAGYAGWLTPSNAPVAQPQAPAAPAA